MCYISYQGNLSENDRYDFTSTRMVLIQKGKQTSVGNNVKHLNRHSFLVQWSIQYGTKYACS